MLSYQVLGYIRISLNLNVYAIITRELIVRPIMNDYSLKGKEKSSGNIKRRYGITLIFDY